MREKIERTGMKHRKIARAALLAGFMVAGLTGCKGGIFGGGDDKTTPTVGNRMPILSRIESGAEVDPSLAAISVVLPPARTNPEWAQAGGSASKSYGHLALAENPAKVWTARIAGSSNRERLAAAPVIGGNTLFAEGTDGVIHAFDRTTGARLWSRGDDDMTKDQAPSAFGGGVSYEAGKLYATNGVGEVKALNADTGEVLWKVAPAGPLRGSPTIAFGQLFVMTQDNQIIALNIADGSLVWDESGSTTQSGVFGVAAPAAGQGTVIAGYSSGELSAYRYENGRTLWSDALARTNISTTVGSITDIDADPIIDFGPRLRARAGRAHGRLRTAHRPAHLGIEPRRHLHPGDCGRVDLHSDRRCPLVGNCTFDWAGALDHPAATLQGRGRQEGPDLLDRPGACRWPAVGRQFAR